MNKKALVLLTLSFCAVMQVRAVTYGTNTGVLRQGNTTFSGVDNAIVGFTFFDNGFTLHDASTELTFDGLFPVRGPIELSGGTMYLLEDLIFSNTATIPQMGYIYGYNHALSLCSSVTALCSPTNTGTFDSINLFLHNDLTLNGTLCFNNSSKIFGNDNRINVGATGVMMVSSNSTVTLQDVIIQGLNGYNLQCIDNTGVIACENVTFVMSGNTVFNNGSLDIIGDTKITGSYTFAYESPCVSTIESGASLLLDKGVTLSYAPSNSGRGNLALVDGTSRLIFNGCTLCSIAPGMQLLNGTLILRNKNYINSNALVLSDAIQMGNGTEANDIGIEIEAGACFEICSGYVDYLDTDY